MTDPELIRKKLVFIETCIQDLKTVAKPELLGKDIKEERFILHTLQIAIQAAQDVASHLVSDFRFGEPESNRELFSLLCKHGWLDEATARTMSAIVGFRNILVHGYQSVNVEIVRAVLRNELDDLGAYVRQIRGMIG